MVSSIKNEEGYIIAYIEWEVVNAGGQFQENGVFGYIQDLWIHKSYRGKRWVLKRLIGKVDRHKFFNNVQYVYWNNLKNDERLTPSYPRERLAKLGEKNGQKEEFTAPTASTATSTKSG